MKNPQAFPSTEEYWYEEVKTGETYYPGMTLRDYFAGQALIGMLSKDLNFDSMIKQCYNIADAMLKERGGQGGWGVYLYCI